MDPFEAALAAQFAAAGAVDALYTAAGVPLPVRVIPSGPTVDLAIGKQTLVVGTALFAVRRADVGEPKRGDTIFIAAGKFAGTYKVSASAELDVERLTWTVPAAVA